MTNRESSLLLVITLILAAIVLSAGGVYFATGSGPAPQPSYTRAEFDAEYRRGLTDGARQATLDAPQCKCGFREYLGKPCAH